MFCNLVIILVLVEKVVRGGLLACQLHVYTVLRMYLGGFLGPFLGSQQRKPPKYVPNLREEGGVGRETRRVDPAWWMGVSLILSRFRSGGAGEDGYGSSFVMALLRTFATDQSLGDLIRECLAGVNGSTSDWASRSHIRVFPAPVLCFVSRLKH